ncbi:MAG: hypothetical protein SFU91_02690 [Chloroherpetonaceae bacterium]|nr:hypothetical protein [Chloroherpetonaceae bacterium]
MSGILPYYNDFSEYIHSGFNPNYQFQLNEYTFPMWGYGFILALTKSKTLIIFFQCFASFLLILLSERVIWRQIRNPKSILIFRLICVLGFSWFLFHGILWPYSFSASLLTLSLLLLFDGLESTFKVFFSGLAFGLALNFRSDYFLFAFLIFFIFFVSSILEKKYVSLLKIFIWAITIFIFLLPWGFYSKAKTGNFLLTSSNSGHHLFISLGQLPGNLWGITPFDHDPKMKSIVSTYFGKEVSTLSAKADPLLKSAWRDSVIAHPVEFVKKCGFNFLLVLTKPFYTGEIEKTVSSYFFKKSLLGEFRPDSFNLKELLSTIHNNPLSLLLLLPKFIVIGVSILVFYSGLFSLGLFLKEIFKGSWKFEPSTLPLHITALVILYQLAILIGVYAMSAYHTNVYLFYAILITIVGDRFFSSQLR